MLSSHFLPALSAIIIAPSASVSVLQPQYNIVASMHLHFDCHWTTAASARSPRLVGTPGCIWSHCVMKQWPNSTKLPITILSGPLINIRCDIKCKSLNHVQLEVVQNIQCVTELTLATPWWQQHSLAYRENQQFSKGAETIRRARLPSSPKMARLNGCRKQLMQQRQFRRAIFGGVYSMA